MTCVFIPPEAKERASKYFWVSECRLSRCLCVCLCFKERNPIRFSVLYLCPLGLTWGYKAEVPTAWVAAHVTPSNRVDLLLLNICADLKPAGWGEDSLGLLCVCAERVQTSRDWGLFILMKCDKADVINSKLIGLHLMLCFWPHNVWQSSSLFLISARPWGKYFYWFAAKCSMMFHQLVANLNSSEVSRRQSEPYFADDYKVRVKRQNQVAVPKSQSKRVKKIPVDVSVHAIPFTLH